MKQYKWVLGLILIAGFIFAVGCAETPASDQVIGKVKSAVVAVNSASGWVYEGSGTIVTNNHVVAGMQDITVRLNNGKTYAPISIKADPEADLAVLKIQAGILPALKISDGAKVKVGDPVVAVGNSNGKGIAGSKGVITRLGVQGSYYFNIIETNAALYQGNSGGPLVNMDGEIIGITFQKSPDGMGYAINIQEALPVIQRLIQ